MNPGAWFLIGFAVLGCVFLLVYGGRNEKK